MSARAIAKNVRISPRKMGIVAALVRGRTVADALVILDHTPRKAAPLLKQAILSAAANAENSMGLKSDDLRIEQVQVSPGLVIKRVRAVSRSRGHRILHRASHIRVALEQKETANAKS